MTTCINIKGYLDQNLNLKTPPKTNIISYVDSIAKNLPGDDQVQAQLTKLMELTIEQDTRIRKEDLDADNANISNLIMEKVAEEKEKLLAGRRLIALELKAKREAERARRATARNDDFKDTFKEIMKKEKEEELLEKQRLAEEERKKLGSAGRMMGSMKGLLGKKLPKLARPTRRGSWFGGGNSVDDTISSKDSKDSTDSKEGEAKEGGAKEEIGGSEKSEIRGNQKSEETPGGGGRGSPVSNIIGRVSPSSFLKKKKKKSGISIPPINITGSKADKEGDEKKDEGVW